MSSIGAIIVHDKGSLEQAQACGLDPIIMRDNEHEVIVYTRREEVVENIKAGMNWHMAIEAKDPRGWDQYIFTRLNEEQLVEHLHDPTTFQGSDG